MVESLAMKKETAPGPGTDEIMMREAIAEAARAAEDGEVPVGAVVIDERGLIIARGRNRPIGKTDPTAHAEIEAIRRACRKAGNYRLTGCTIYVTIEPCPMCLGAIVQARLARVVYGADDPKAGAVRSVMEFPFDRMNHRPSVQGGVLSAECGGLVRVFFAGKRKKTAGT